MRAYAARAYTLYYTAVKEIGPQNVVSPHAERAATLLVYLYTVLALLTLYTICLSNQVLDAIKHAAAVQARQVK